MPDNSYPLPALVAGHEPPANDSASAPDRIEYNRTRLAPVSLSDLRSRLVVFDQPGDVAAEAFKLLRTHVLFWLAERQGASVAVSSPAVGEGKTTTAINLAMHIAAVVDYTVLLVDANLRHPKVHEYFGWEARPGLSNHLIDKTPLEDLLVHPGVGRLVVLPAGDRLLNSSEMLGSRAMAALVEEFKGRYPRRIIVFDLPPVLDASDALAFSRHVDGMLLVVKEGLTRRRDLIRTELLLPPEKLIGLTMNGSTLVAPQRGLQRFGDS